MNNYNLIEKILHKVALSSQFMREITFDAENSFVNLDPSSESHVFITGLARSGTTILLNSLYKSNEFASLTYADMPFVLAPNLWRKIYRQKIDFGLKERAHGDGIKFSIDSPEAFEEVFWKTFEEDKSEVLSKFKVYIENILHKYDKERYLSKNNQNIRRVNFLAESFPNSQILIPFREPSQHAYSLLRQHKKFINYSKKDNFISKYMKYIGHTEFGPNYKTLYEDDLLFKDDLNLNHWIEQWYFIYKDCFSKLKNKENVIFISYEKMCNESDYWFEILELLNIKDFYSFKFKESFKDINLQIDNDLKEKAISLYAEITESIQNLK